MNKVDVLFGLAWLALGAWMLGDQPVWLALAFMGIGVLSLVAGFSPRVHDTLLSPIGRRR